MTKIVEFTVVYPVSFRMEVPDNYETLSLEEQESLRNDILNKADNLFGNDSAPEIQKAHLIVEEEMETDNLDFFTNL